MQREILTDRDYKGILPLNSTPTFHDLTCIVRRREALTRWKSGPGKAGTYRALIEVFYKAGKLDYADVVCDLLKEGAGKH